MTKSCSFIWTLILCLTGQFISIAHGYELATHGTLTQQAFLQSDLNSADQHLVKDLGINIQNNPDQPFGTIYYDVSGTAVKERTNWPFEDDIIKKLGIVPLSLQGWLMRGAIREDDLGYVLGIIRIGETGQPYDDPYGDITRVVNHFFDPYNNKPLTVANVALGDTAPNWGIGATNAFATTPVPNTSRRNHFTVYDAREAMYRAITGKDKGGNLAGRDSNGNPVATTEAMRKAYWATTFRALGDILHLNQDMAQPQHTRNEKHAGKSPAMIFGEESTFERYIDARAKGDTVYSFDGTPATPLLALTYTGYAIPAFAKYSDYWSTSQGAGSLTGKGLADYSNRGFFTAAHNIDDTTYTSPPPTPNDTAVYTPQTGTCDYSATYSASVNYLVGKVSDTVTQSQNSIKLTTSSTFNGLGTAGASYSLNKCNYDDMASLLIPRAVGYSAGLLNYFFRGRMAVSLPDEGVYAIVDHARQYLPDGQSNHGFARIKLKLQNTTSAIVPPGSTAQAQDMTGGQLVAVAKYRKNLCYTTNLSGEKALTDATARACRGPEELIVTSTAVLDSNNQPVTSVNLTAGAAPQTFTFVFPTPIPINMTDFYLQVVYRGPLGQESDAVAVATKDIAEPTFWSVHNVTDYLYCANGAWYYKDAAGNIPPGQPGYGDPSWNAQSFGPTKIAFQPNTASNPLADIATTAVPLPPGHYAQLAVLTETGRSYDWYSQGFFSPPPGIFSTAINQLGQVSPTVTHYTYVATAAYRNTYAHTWGFAYKASIASCPSNPPPEPGYTYTAILNPVAKIYGGLTDPYVSAGVSQTVAQAANITLSASGIAPNGTIAQYNWVQTAGTPVTLSNPTSATPSFTAPTGTADTVLTFQLTATDSSGVATTSTVNITVLAPSAPPAGMNIVTGNQRNTINWSPVAGASSYNLYWSTTPGVTPATGAKITNVSNTYTQTGLTNGTAYYYVVTAVNAVGEESVASTQAVGSPVLADGDLNGDGVVNIVDVLFAARIAEGLMVPTAAQLAHGDVAPASAPDGKIDVLDVLRIVRKMQHLEIF